MHPNLAILEHCGSEGLAAGISGTSAGVPAPGQVEKESTKADVAAAETHPNPMPNLSTASCQYSSAKPVRKVQLDQMMSAPASIS